MSTTISALTATGTIDGSTSYFPIDIASPLGTYKINRDTFLGVSGSPADISTVQTFTNKVIGNTNTVTVKDTLFTIQDDGDTTKQAKFQASGITTATTRTYTLPDANTTLVGTGVTQTLTGKTLTSPVITGGTIDNSTITVDSIAGHTSASTVTVAGLQITSGVLVTSNSVVATNVAASAITPEKLLSGNGTTWPTTAYTPTVTGWAATPTVSARYIQIGKTVFLNFTISGTSNTTGATMTLPVAARSSGSFTYDGMNGYAQNNSAEITTGSRWFIDPGASTTLVNFYKDTAFAVWTNSGTKLVRGLIIYEAA